MGKICLIIIYLLCVLNGNSQKLYGVLNLTTPYSGISYADNYNKAEFNPSIPRFNISWRIDAVMPSKKISHKLSFEHFPLDKQFRITNIFWNTPGDPLTQLGVREATFGTGVSMYILSYSIQKEDKRHRKFLSGTKMKFNYSAGLGLSPNRTRKFFINGYSNSSDGFFSQESYIKYEALHFRTGVGIFLKTAAGVDLFNKKGKRRLCLNMFLNLGINEMVRYDIHYEYGYWHDPAKQVDINQELKSRGTNFGFSLGLPIRIIK